MKKLLTTTVLALFAFVCTWAQASMSGSGTESDPYKIYYAEQLNEIRHFYPQSAYFKLMNDIDLTEWINDNNGRQGWEPINNFLGVLDGNGKKITGFTINRSTTDYVGFFAKTSGATIKDLTIEGDVTGGNYVGGVVGDGGTCYFSGITFKGNISGTSKVGGIVGSSHGSMKDITFVGNVSGSSNYVGGITGGAWGDGNATIKNVSVQGNVTASSASYVGGIAGYSISIIDNAIYTGVVSGGNSVGGIVGYEAYNSTNTTLIMVNKVYAYGTVKGNHYVGGVIGKLEKYLGKTSGTANYVKKIDNCYSYCDVTGTGSCIGGVMGQGIISTSNCASFGDISGTNYVGGVIGFFGDSTLSVQEFTDSKASLGDVRTEEMTMANCCSVGNVTASGNYVGGVCGIVDNAYTWSHEYNSYYNKYYYIPTITFLILTDSYFSGDLQGKNYVGGVVGLGNHITISQNYSNASINGAVNVGGIVGSFQSNTNNLKYKTWDTFTVHFSGNNSVLTSNMSINSAVVATSNGGRIYGSIDASGVTVGVNGNTSEDNRSLESGRLIISGVTQELDDSQQNGVNNGIAYFRSQANYVSHGFNLNDDWSILNTESFPYKKWQAAPPTITSSLVSGDQTISGKSINGGKVYVKIDDNDPLEAVCSGNDWTLSGIARLKSGQGISMYVKAEGLEYSYRTKATVGYPGSGTEADPWRVYDAYDLQGVYKAGYYKQMEDINLTTWINANSSSKGWVPVGFSGEGSIVYDGDNHKITGLWINTTEDYNGLFSNFSSGTIRNLTVEASIKGVKGSNYTGILIGKIGTGTIENVNVKGNVTGKSYVGGIAGYALTAFSKLAYSGKLTATGYVGGITGCGGYSVGNAFIDCKVTDLVINATNSTHVGGIVGYTEGSINNCHASGTITLSGTVSGAAVGGLAGESRRVIESSANVDITSSSPGGMTGGLVGKKFANLISLCFSKGSVTSTGADSYTGGLVGKQSNGMIRDCYSTAEVTGTNFTAGLVGYNNNTVKMCYASGNISSVYHAAGLVGYNDGANAIVTNCVAMNEIVNVSDQSGWGIRVIGDYANGAPEPDDSNFAWEGMQVSENGVPKKIKDNPLDGQSLTAIQTKSRETYEALSWDFESNWTIGTGYPQLKWQGTVADVTKGDLDGDGSIDIADIVLIIDVIAGLCTDETMLAAADVNGDGDVDVADIVSCIDLMAGVTSAPSLRRAANNDYITANLLDNKVEVSLNNQTLYTAFQMTVTLPEGLSLKKAVMDKTRGEFHQVTTRKLNDQDYLVMGFSMDKDVLEGNEGRLLTLLTEGEANGEIRISNVLFATPKAETVQLNAFSIQGGTTGIQDVTREAQNTEVYDLQGRKVNGNAKSGLYIVNGKKVVMK